MGNREKLEKVESILEGLKSLRGVREIEDHLTHSIDNMALARTKLALQVMAEKRYNEQLCHCGRLGYHRFNNDCVPF